MHEMQTIVTVVRGVCLSISLFVCHAAKLAARAVCEGSFSAAFAKLLRPLVVTYLNAELRTVIVKVQWYNVNARQ